jgi:predicted dehydrogenase
MSEPYSPDHARIRVGIVGATVTSGGSGWGAHAHVPALQALPELYQLKAVCTAHEETAKASATAFGAELAFADFDRMLERPDIDLIVVCVRAPEHHKLTMRSLEAGKATFCEWPLGANLPEAEEMADLARTRRLPTLVGLQARSDPAIRAARELIVDDYVGTALVANMSYFTSGSYQRGKGRIWQAWRQNGANPLTIPGGHSMDIVRFLLGDFTEIAAHLTTQVRQWTDTDHGHPIEVDAPDTISVVARTHGGAETTMQIATVPTGGSEFRCEIYGTAGRLVLGSNTSVNTGPTKLLGAKGKDALAELPIPDRLKLVPPSLPDAPRSTNVAHAYVRYAQARAAGQPCDPDFDAALSMHRVIDAIERSSAEGFTVRLP